jgi:hypothetical protein
MRFAYLFVFVTLAAAQPTSDLLESAVWAQDTAGDLDRAIRLYRQILSDGPLHRMYAPQAQFRLGQCLLLKGDRRGASAAFEAVIRNYPNEPVLAARAREFMPAASGELLPAPWRDREISEYRWSFPGVSDAWSIATIAPAPAPRSHDRDRIQLLYYLPEGHALRVDLDRATMRPTGAMTSGTAPRTLSPGAPFEAAEVLYLLRRVMLAPGTRGSLPAVLADGRPLALQYAVEGIEDVTVPAGEFSCYRVRLTAAEPHVSVIEGRWPAPAGGELLWYSTAPPRSLVKMASGAATGELTLRSALPAGDALLRNPGYSLVVPADWVQHTRLSEERHATTIDLILIEGGLSIRIILNNAPEQRTRPLAAAAAERIRILSTRHGVYTVREQPSPATLGGHPALQWRALFSDGTATEETGICAESESFLATVLIYVPEGAVERLRPRYQPILDSIRLR